MKKKVKTTLKYLLFFAIGVFIFWMIYKDQDLEMIKSVLQNDVNYLWIWISLIIGIFSHISRAIRWNYLIEPLGSSPRLLNTFLAVMTGYLMNLVIPRMGEISRCGVLSKYEKISFARLIGTVVTERVIDVIVLLIMTAITILAQFGYILRFLRDNPTTGEKVISILRSPYLIASVLVGAVLLITMRKKIMRTRLYKRLGNTVEHLKEGIISVKYVRKKGALIFHSVFIWIMYYLMLYTAFFAFDFTKTLSSLAGLTTFVMGSLGMVAPVQGGLGTWHFMTKEGLALYGVSNENGIIFAFVAHTTMNLMIIVVGLLSLMALPIINRNKQ
ncbi:MAG: lysylphosphatidylglycerol synthase transmembrane domain-containing protein [Prolixibacteraceae bacterium]|nr:flippase-like domain-containing protein [Prolixibacteraceae bacterium]MDI9564339.1 lysylphosphatidylglycerol synthase transmembrane domain-containing protein [Bacteroidota bacterium]NLS99263.1 flippase-like domain-containing protein [Bacteroidales bacterium]OQB79691.1 MAG: hypothetical protein BWX87_01993 [Bacteroidetes bacterium ADurb.Bin123]HNU76915.1 lysylphosphatidylglycerol synthase transmembrane domain-containing protein [Prolixibacteraceae bacterium]